MTIEHGSRALRRIAPAVLLALCVPALAVWQVETVGPPGIAGDHLSACLDAAGELHAVTAAETGGPVRYLRESEGSWSLEEVDQGTGPVSMAVDGVGGVHLAYRGSERHLRFAYRGSTGWSPCTVDAEGEASHLSLDLAPDERPRIAYDAQLWYPYPPPGSPYHVLRHAAWDGAQWIREEIEDLNLDMYYGTTVSLAVDGLGESAIALRNEGGMPGIASAFYLCQIGEGWARECIDDGDFPENVGRDACLVVDASGRSHLAYRNTSRAILRFASRGEQGWSGQTVGPLAWDDGPPSLAVDRIGRPRIAWAEPEEGVLRYARREAAGWTVETIEGAAAGGKRVVLLLDEDLGLLHVFFAGAAGGDLGHAWQELEPDPLEYRLQLSDAMLRPGDLLRLTRSASNPAPDPRSVREHVVLDVDGQYWFWPSWSPTLDGRDSTLHPGTSPPAPILELTWPDGAGSMDGLRFWGAFLDPESSTLLAFDVVEWSFGS